MNAGWRQSLGAGLLLGLALGCGWLVHWTPQLSARVLLAAAAGLLAMLGLALMLSLGGGRGWSGRWRRRLELPFAAAGVPFFAVLVILAVAALTSGNNLLYLLVSGLLAALAISGLTSALNLSGMLLRFRLPEEIFAGQPVTVGFRLSNDKGFWPSYSLTVAAAEGSEAAMQPVYFAYLARRDSVAADSELCFPRRGCYAATAFEVSTRFPFGILHQRRRFQPQGREPETLVYPAPAPRPALARALPRPGSEAVRAVRGDGMELHRIRALQPGDSARQVHWKASARAGALRVREFSREEGSRLRLRLRIAPGLPAEAAERALSECAAWLLAAVESDCWLAFEGDNTPALALPFAPATRHRRAVLDYLARLRYEPAAGAPTESGPPLEPSLEIRLGNQILS